MGKTTCFHPVSLPIIRESARQGGFVLGRIHQDTLKHDNMTALYTLEIKIAPTDSNGESLWRIHDLLNNCFSTDIQVLRCWKTRSQRIYAELCTTVDPKNISRDPHCWMMDMTEKEMLEALDAMGLDIDDIEGLDWLDTPELPSGEIE